VCFFCRSPYSSGPDLGSSSWRHQCPSSGFLHPGIFFGFSLNAAGNVAGSVCWLWGWNLLERKKNVRGEVGRAEESGLNLLAWNLIWLSQLKKNRRRKKYKILSLGMFFNIVIFERKEECKCKYESRLECKDGSRMAKSESSRS
jgi:hypothetical protein